MRPLLPLIPIAVLTASLATSSLAAAQNAAPAPAEPPGPGAHVHDGFYFRVATGFSAFQETVGHGSSDSDPRSLVSGMGTAGELSIGGTIKKGLVLGIGSYGTTALATDVTLKNGGVPAEAIAGTPSLALFGPFFDWYFDPTKGLHLQGSIGFASARTLTLDNGKIERDQVSWGGGAMVGFGNEWWIGEQWSIGILGRVSVAATTNRIDGVRYWHTISAAPAVLLTLTYH